MSRRARVSSGWVSASRKVSRTLTANTSAGVGDLATEGRTVVPR